MDNKEKFEKLFHLLKGWNLENYCNRTHFDFYNKKGNAILTLVYINKADTLQVTDNVEFYYNDTNYEIITLDEYRQTMKG